MDEYLKQVIADAQDDLADEEDGFVHCQFSHIEKIITKSLLNYQAKVREMVKRHGMIHEHIIATHEVLPKNWHEGNIHAVNEFLVSNLLTPPVKK